MKKKICRLFSIAITAIMLLNVFLSTPITAAKKNEKYVIKPVGNKVKSKVEFNYESNEALLGEMKKVAENKDFELLIHEKNLAIALKSKKDGSVLTSNPYDAATQISYNGNNKKQMDSQIVIEYDNAENKRNLLFSSSDAAELGQFKITPIKNGVKVRYSIGVEKTVQLVPAIIGKKDYENVIKKLEEKDESRAVRRLKVLYKKDKYDNGDDIYKSKKLSDKELNEVERYFVSAGYTEEMFEADRKKYKSETEAKYFPNFQMDLEYRLTDKGFSVTLPYSSIYYDDTKFKLISIKVLEFFGASNSAYDKDGFVFLPDGSGAIIPFEKKNDETAQAMISKKVYGMDNTVSKTVEMFAGKQCYLPIFGTVEDNRGYIAIIEEGSAIANIVGYSANSYGKYFASFPKFEMMDSEKMELEQKVASHGSESKTIVYNTNNYKGNIKISYNFLSEDKANLVGMAEEYRNYLFSKGMNSKFGVTQDFLTVETIGTLNYVDNFLGIKYDSEAKLTTFEDSKNLLKKFKKNGVGDVSLILNAWRKGGLDSGIANKFNPSSVLGGKKGFESLYKYCKDNKIDFYPDVDLLNISKDKMFDGFNPRKDATRLLNKEYGGKKIINLDTGLIDKEKFFYALSPNLYGKTLNKFLNKYNKKFENLGLSSIGKELNSNFKSDNLVNRAQSLEITEDLIKKASKKNKLMFEGANGYCLPYSDFLEKLPLSSSENKGTVSVPFVQILLNGYVKYSSEELNYESDYKKATLKCIESATSPHFVLASDNIIKIKETDYTEYYSVDADTLFDSVLESFKTYEEALKPVKNSKISNYSILEEDIVKVSYQNGYCIILNYTDSEYTCEEGTVGAMSSITVKEATEIEE